MDKSRNQKPLRTKQISVSRHEEDRLSNLPDSLLCQIMLHLPSIKVIESCVLSKRWRNLWRYVPGLDVESDYFDDDCHVFVSFVKKFLSLNRESCFQSCKLICHFEYEEDKSHLVHVTDFIDNIVVKRKVKYLTVSSNGGSEDEYVKIPLSVYTSETLVSLDLSEVFLLNPSLIYLPCVKVMELDSVVYANGMSLEKLISSCPVLESLVIHHDLNSELDHVRVCSKSLQRFKYVSVCDGYYGDQIVLEIDAPKLEYLSLLELMSVSVRVKNLESLVEADIDLLVFDEDPEDEIKLKKNMILDFLLKISCVKKLSISTNTIQVLFDDLRCGCCQLQFHNLSYLQADFMDCNLKMLSTFLESCPNLKSLAMKFEESSDYVDDDGVRVVLMPKCLLTSLEYVEIEDEIAGDSREMELVSYFLKNSAILKKLTLWLDDFEDDEKIKTSVVSKELLSITRLSTSCQVDILHNRWQTLLNRRLDLDELD